MKRVLISAMIAILGLFPVAVLSASAYADAGGEICNGIAVSGGDCSSGSSGINGLVRAVIQILSLIVGIAAVILIIIAAIKYVTSGGEANNVSSAKNTLIYALVGLVVAGLAQFLVHFVLHETTSATNQSSSSQQPNGG